MKKLNKTKTYIGDGVYVEYEFGQIILTTDRGRSDNEPDRIILDPEVLDALLKFVDTQKTESR